MRVTLNFCEANRSLLFDLGMIIIFREISGVDLIADGDKRDNIKIAQTVFVCAYKRSCQDAETPEDLTTEDLKKAFLRLNMFQMNQIMSAFSSIMSVEQDPDAKKDIEAAPGKAAKKK